MRDFLRNRLNLEFHPDKVMIRKLRQGIDFLGYVVLPRHIILRTKTKRRMFKKLRQGQGLPAHFQRVQSYLGLLKHCSGHNLEMIIRNSYCQNNENSRFRGN